MKPPFLPDDLELFPTVISEVVRSSTNEQDIILDPFSVCGASAVEILRLGRRAVVIERSPVSAFFAETLLRPVPLPDLQWGFQDVRDACRESFSRWFATTCPKCGKPGTLESLARENGKPARIEYSCPCSRGTPVKKPDADDLSAEEGIARLEIPFWHPVLHLSTVDGCPHYPQDVSNRRTVAALSTILHAVEELAESSARDALKAAFGISLGAGSARGPLSPSGSAGKRTRAETQREENPWPAFETAFRRLYETKKKNNQILKDAAVARSFAELASGRANVLILSGADPETAAGGLPEDSIDGAAGAAPSEPDARERLEEAVRAAWLKMDCPQAPASERLAAACRVIRRAGKPGALALILCGADGATELHGLLNQMEKNGLPVEKISFRPAAKARGPGGAYILRSQIQKTEFIPPVPAVEASLVRKLADTASIRLLLHGSTTTAGKILHAFYPQLGRAEIASVAKYAIEDLMARAVDPFARYRGGKFIPRKGKRKPGGGRRIPPAWRRIMLDGEALAAGSDHDIALARELTLRRLARESLTAEDADALRRMLHPAEIQRRRKERAAGLLRTWGRALGHSVRTGKGSAPIVAWRTAEARTVEFTLGRREIAVGSRDAGRPVSRWGSISYFNLERGMGEWRRNHPQLEKDLPAEFPAPENFTGIDDGADRPAGITASDWKLRVVTNAQICDRHFLITLNLPKNAELDCRPGQFFHLECDPENGEQPYPLTLRRPLSIHRARRPGFDPAALARAEDIPEEVRFALQDRPSRLEFLYRLVGEGTGRLSRIRRGTMLRAIGPCGNGFTLGEERTAVIVAGGIGIAPLAALAERLRFCGKEVLVYIGAVEKEMLHLSVTRDPEKEDRDILDAVEAEFRGIGAQILTVCTDDGSAGQKGLVTEMLERGIQGGCVPRESVRLYACGPEAMLQAVAEIAARHGLECEVSLEERMACGIGACYSCTVTAKSPDGSKQKKRICREGPVFQARDILWKD